MNDNQAGEFIVVEFDMNGWAVRFRGVRQVFATIDKASARVDELLAANPKARVLQSGARRSGGAS